MKICKYTDVGFFIMTQTQSYNNLVNCFFSKNIVELKDNVKKISLKNFAPFLFKSIPEYPLIITLDAFNNNLLFEVDCFKFERKLASGVNYFLPFFLICNNEIRMKHHFLTEKLFTGNENDLKDNNYSDDENILDV